MKFGKWLLKLLAPEWKGKYIAYEGLKKILENYLKDVPLEEEVKEEIISQLEARFFADCQEELIKINLFYTERLAEAKEKLHQLDLDMATHREAISRTTEQAGQIGQRFGLRKIQRKVTKTDKQLKDAFSEFYLSLTILESYQTLNGSGFKKILKKHDKVVGKETGQKWMTENVENANFFTDREVDNLLALVEDSLTELEGGNREAAKMRLKVPPRSEKETPMVTRPLRWLSRANIVLTIIILLSWQGLPDRPDEPKWVALRLFRGQFLIIFALFLHGGSTCIYEKTGVNHVLIFRLDPRDCLTGRAVLQIANILYFISALAVIAYQYAHLICISIYAPPFVSFICKIVIFLYSLSKPDFHRSARLWLRNHLGHCCIGFLFYKVNFADFWLGDQLNSLATAFIDIQYLLCFYPTKIHYLHGWHVRAVNSTNGDIGWFEVDIATGNDMWSSTLWRYIGCIPAAIRLLQCVRRYCDLKQADPYLLNAAKYAMTILVVICGVQYKLAMRNDSNLTSLLYCIWFVISICSSLYAFWWDIYKDWGLGDRGSRWLRKEMIYSSVWYYYVAIVLDFVLRFTWTLNFLLDGTVNSEIIKTWTALAELIRRFVWNFFRLENEHLNNCGNFRIVRDISVKPLTTEALEAIMRMDPNDESEVELSLWQSLMECTRISRSHRTPNPQRDPDTVVLMETPL